VKLTWWATKACAQIETSHLACRLTGPNCTSRLTCQFAHLGNHMVCSLYFFYVCRLLRYTKHCQFGSEPLAGLSNWTTREWRACPRNIWKAGPFMAPGLTPIWQVSQKRSSYLKKPHSQPRRTCTSTVTTGTPSFKHGGPIWPLFHSYSAIPMGPSICCWTCMFTYKKM